jgi:uncharacterized protein with von Willebrand factor type A (vWA) domain
VTGGATRVGPRAAGPDLRANCVRFGRLLRANGLPVGQDRVLRWLRSLDLLRCEHPADLYWSGRVNLVASAAHLARYDQLFREFWLTLDHPALGAPKVAEESGRSGRELPRRSPLAPPAPEGDGEGRGGPGREHEGAGGGEDRRWQIGLPYRPPVSDASVGEPPPDPEPDAEVGVGLYSSIEVLREKDFSHYQGEDEALLAQWLDRWPEWLQPLTASRRLRPAPRGALLDLRRSVAEAVRHGGDPVRLQYRRRRLRWRKWVFLLDISASMAPYTRALLLLLQAVASRRRATEVFLFGTRLTRVTPQLRRPMAAGGVRGGGGTGGGLFDSVRDWHGGTRLGEALEQFEREYGRRGMAHGAVLFILSDGLDLGAAGQVARAMGRLERLAERICWVNPLKRTEAYQPLARAMAEALPYLDAFVSGHNLESLAALLRSQALADA